MAAGMVTKGTVTKGMVMIGVPFFEHFEAKEDEQGSDGVVRVHLGDESRNRARVPARWNRGVVLW